MARTIATTPGGIEHQPNGWGTRRLFPLAVQCLRGTLILVSSHFKLGLENEIDKLTEAFTNEMGGSKATAE